MKGADDFLRTSLHVKPFLHLGKIDYRMICRCENDQW
jgi:hypothetical protein